MVCRVKLSKLISTWIMKLMWDFLHLERQELKHFKHLVKLSAFILSHFGVWMRCCPKFGLCKASYSGLSHFLGTKLSTNQIEINSIFSYRSLFI